MTRKLKSETSSQKIDVSADIIPGSLTLLTVFVILDLKITVKRYNFVIMYATLLWTSNRFPKINKPLVVYRF